jgi:hypothetical protein
VLRTGFVATTRELKLDAFPFTRYRLLSGTVVAVDRDAEAAPVSQSGAQRSRRMADAIDQVEGSERLRYTVNIALQRERSTSMAIQRACCPACRSKRKY